MFELGKFELKRNNSVDISLALILQLHNPMNQALQRTFKTQIARYKNGRNNGCLFIRQSPTEKRFCP